MSDPARFMRRLMMLRILGALSALILIPAALVVFAIFPASGAAPVIFVVAISLRFVTAILGWTLGRRWRRLSYAAGPPNWWNRKGRVAESQGWPGFGWDGPYGSRADAEQAQDIARERAAAWNADDE